MNSFFCSFLTERYETIYNLVYHRIDYLPSIVNEFLDVFS